MTSFQIRKASALDLEALDTLNIEVHDFHRAREPDVFKPLAPGAIRDQILSFLNGKNTVTFVAEDRGRILGFVQAKTEVSPENPFHKPLPRGIINAIGVTSEVKRSGIGSQLLEAAEGWIREQGFHEILLNVWGFNESANHFYKERGYSTSSRKLVKKI